LERSVHNHIYEIVKRDINVNQHGFVKQRSTVTQLLEFYNNVYSCLDNKKQMDVIYLDLSKAFDCIPHKLLIHKLKSFGISGSLLLWIENYLSNRWQRVVVEGSSSNYLKVLSGVPQGSILGPLFFIMYINDIFNNVSSETDVLYLYADDSKLGSTINNVNDCINMQAKLDLFVNWGNCWGMNFNPKKCCVMTFTNNKSPVNFTYSINGSDLTKVDEFNDLGVIVSSKLTWDTHINNCVTKANKRLGLIKRCVGYEVSNKAKLLCYKSLVRPLLEYGTMLWSCNSRKTLIRLESVQRRASKYILNNFISEYDVRLNACELLPLTLRRDFLDCLFLYNNLHGLVDSNILNLVSFNQNRGRNNDDLMLNHKRVHLETCRNFYINRITNLWNSVPYELRSIELTESGYNTSFKNNLKAWFIDYFRNNFRVEDVCTWVVCCTCHRCRRV
jgi:hypothetical protein